MCTTEKKQCQAQNSVTKFITTLSYNDCKGLLILKQSAKTWICVYVLFLFFKFLNCFMYLTHNVCLYRRHRYSLLFVGTWDLSIQGHSKFIAEFENEMSEPSYFQNLVCMKI